MMVLELVSFDWDYCVPIHAANDWGHQETMLFFKTVWNARFGVFTKKDNKLIQIEMGDLLPEVNFPRVYPPFRFGIGESHIHAFEHFIYSIEIELKAGHALDQEPWEIHHYDLHHDIWPFGSESKELVEAQNWMRHFVHWLRRKFPDSHIDLIWHTPFWFEKQGYNTKAFGWRKYKRLIENSYEIKCEHVSDTKELGFMRPVSTFICRSGSWTPPHLDPYFSTLCRDIMNLIGEESNRSQLMPVRVYKAYQETIDPLESRSFNYVALDALKQLKILTEKKE